MSNGSECRIMEDDTRTCGQTITVYNTGTDPDRRILSVERTLIGRPNSEGNTGHSRFDRARQKERSRTYAHLGRQTTKEKELPTWMYR